MGAAGSTAGGMGAAAGGWYAGMGACRFLGMAIGGTEKLGGVTCRAGAGGAGGG